MTVRPRLLFLCQTLPYPPDSGVSIRTYHVLRLLAREFTITALCFERARGSGKPGDGDMRAALDGLGGLADVSVFPIPQKHSRLRYVWDHLRSAALRRAYTEFLYESPAFERRLMELLNTRPFDLVHADSLVDLVRYLPMCDPIPIIGVHHNVESNLLRRGAMIEPPGVRGAYLRYQARLVEGIERKWCDRVTLNIVVSPVDLGSLQRIAPNARIIVVPNGVDVDHFRPTPVKGRGIAYTGGAEWFPNRDALQFFCDQILPHLRAAPIDIPVRWIGGASAEQRRTYQSRYGVELTGHVKDAQPFMREAACHIVPLRVGGGSRLKILNAWAMGKPVVSTAIGCEGLAAEDGENILIRDDPRSFASAIVTVLENDALRRRLADNGRETAERLYGWDVIGRGMIDSYLSVARSRPQTVEARRPKRDGSAH